MAKTKLYSSIPNSEPHQGPPPPYSIIVSNSNNSRVPTAADPSSSRAPVAANPSNSRTPTNPNSSRTPTNPNSSRTLANGAYGHTTTMEMMPPNSGQHDVETATTRYSQVNKWTFPPIAFPTQLLTGIQHRLAPHGCYCNCVDCLQFFNCVEYFSCADVNFGCCRVRAGMVAVCLVVFVVCLGAAILILSRLYSK